MESERIKEIDPFNEENWDDDEVENIRQYHILKTQSSGIIHNTIRILKTGDIQVDWE